MVNFLYKYVCCVFVTLMSPCMEDSLAKAVCNNNNFLCCNSKFIVESN